MPKPPNPMHDVHCPHTGAIGRGMCQACAREGTSITPRVMQCSQIPRFGAVRVPAMTPKLCIAGGMARSGLLSMCRRCSGWSSSLDRAPLMTLLLSCESVMVIVVPRFRSSPTHAMEALHHEHCCTLGGEGWGRMDPYCFWSTCPATMERHEGQKKTAAWWTFVQEHSSKARASVKEREGKGSKWRLANRCRKLQNTTTNPGNTSPPPPSHVPANKLLAWAGGGTHKTS